MELISEIHDEDIGFESRFNQELYKLRKASRAVIFNNFEQIALLFVSKNDYHKLPGGGIENGENIKEALMREVMEETGTEIAIDSDIGVIIEFRSKYNLLQISYCYLAKALNTSSPTSFTAQEQSDGFQLKWVDFNKALNLIKNDSPKDYTGKFIQKRDYAFLLKAAKLPKPNLSN